MKVAWEKIGKVAAGLIVVCLGVSISLYALYRVIRGKPDESVTEVQNGAFKILIRSQEFRHSGTVNVDICVAHVSSVRSPTRGSQCFLHGFDLDHLSAKWRGQHEIEISLADGYVTEFSNYVSAVNPKSALPEQFHVTLRDDHCNSYPKFPIDLKPCPSTE